MSKEFKNVYIKTYGCQMNVYDSELIGGILQKDGFSLIDDERLADIILLNTCSVRDLAEKKVFGKIGELNKLRKAGDLIIGICGCMAQNLKEEIIKKAPYVDIVCGTKQIDNIGKLVLEAVTKRKKVIATSFEGKVSSYKTRVGSGSLSSYVSVMSGCENFCTYCIVPFVRGKEASREATEILDEVKMLVDSGCKEITLLGQNVNSYGNDLSPNVSFAELLVMVNEIKGLKRIRFVTSHPKDAGRDLFLAMRDLDKVCEYLHLPIQSGSNAILKLMNRGYTKEEYLSKVESVREIIPNVALSTDIIVGFPYEDEADFLETLAIMNRVKFDTAFMFKYSIRSKTKAALMPQQINKQEKERRHKILLENQELLSLESGLSEIGNIEEVLVEGVSKRNKARLFGRTRRNKLTVFEGKMDLIGNMVNLKIINATSHTLYGELI